MMIGVDQPASGLQPFTKRFGQPLHGTETKENATLPSPVKDEDISNSSLNPNITDTPVDDEIDKAIDFSYESDGDDSVASDNQVEESVDPFLVENSDILPLDTPLDTINTLKALKSHIETSENRAFTNLERQLLATIVHHGILNAKQPASKSVDANADTVDHQEKRNNEQNSKPNSPSSDSYQSEAHKSDSESQDEDINQKPNDNTYATIYGPPLPMKKVLLPTPSTLEAKNEFKLNENDITLLGERRASKPVIELELQKKLCKSVDKKKLPKNLNGSYHPDDEPTLALLENLNGKKDDSPAYEDLLNSFVATKKRSPSSEEPKVPKTQKHHHSRTHLHSSDKRHRIHQTEHHSSTSNHSRKVISRKEYSNSPKSEPRKVTRRVKVGYKEVKRDKASERPPEGFSEKPKNRTGGPSSSGLSDDRGQSKRKRVSPSSNVGETRPIKDKQSKAVDMLADFITKKVMCNIAEADNHLEDNVQSEEGEIIDSKSEPFDKLQKLAKALIPGFSLQSSQSPEGIPMGLPAFTPFRMVSSVVPQVPLNPLNSFQDPPFKVNQTEPVPTPILIAPKMGHPGIIIEKDSRPNLITLVGKGSSSYSKCSNQFTADSHGNSGTSATPKQMETSLKTNNVGELKDDNYISLTVASPALPNAAILKSDGDNVGVNSNIIDMSEDTIRGEVKEVGTNGTGISLVS